jgi:hypothetical protein
MVALVTLATATGTTALMTAGVNEYVKPAAAPVVGKFTWVEPALNPAAAVKFAVKRRNGNDTKPGASPGHAPPKLAQAIPKQRSVDVSASAPPARAGSTTGATSCAILSVARTFVALTNVAFVESQQNLTPRPVVVVVEELYIPSTLKAADAAAVCGVGVPATLCVCADANAAKASSAHVMMRILT